MTTRPATVNSPSLLVSLLSIFGIGGKAGNREAGWGLRTARRRSSSATLSPSVRRILKSKPSRLPAFLLPPALALPHWPTVEVDAASASRLCQGQTIQADPAWPQGAVRVFAGPAEFVALGTVTVDGRLAPERVFRR